MAQKLRVLIVEDNERDAALLVRELQRGGYELTYRRVETKEGMSAALVNEAWDLVVSDFAMPRFSAPAALALVRERQLDLPVIIVSGTVGEEVAVEAMRAGAHDFMPKGQFSRLLPAIEREMREAAGRVERRTIESQLRRAQRMEAIGHLTGGIAHDFNNLLGVIIGNVEALLESVRANPDQVELAEEVLKGAGRGADLTHRLLAFARQQPLSPRVVDLNERLPAILAMLRRTLGESIHVSATLAEGLWPTRIDPSQIEDALLNLAINARDAMPNGGGLTIETMNAQLDEHYALLHSDAVSGDYVALSVTDTGVGMSPEIVEHALEPFFTTKEQGKGTGLGLSMVYGFSKQSGGHLSIYSEVGVGTTVRLYLPRDRSGAANVEAQPARVDALPTGGESILLVDDNVGLRRIAIRRLTSLGYKVREADSGPAALAILKSGERFDLLFTDIGLPNGISGTELADLAQQIQPPLKVLFTTGYAKVQTWNGDPSYETKHLLRKPYRGAELASRIREALDDG
jgi:signal transduction histidine kinase